MSNKNASSSSSDNGPIAFGDQLPPPVSATQLPDPVPPPPPSSSGKPNWRIKQHKKIAIKLDGGEQS
jgi:hypothetical protein